MVQAEGRTPALPIATSSVAPKSVSDVAIYPAVYCQQLAAAALVSAVPATTDSGTATWLANGLALAQVAARAVAFIAESEGKRTVIPTQGGH